MSDNPIIPHLTKVLDEQDAYRAASPSILPRAVRSVTAPLGNVTRGLIPAEVVEAAIKGADWVAEASVRSKVLSHDFSDLEACDQSAADVQRWAFGFAVTSGGAAGAFGAAGLAFDIPATMTLALRTARLTGLAYGFGGAGTGEQVYILDILQLAAANSLAERGKAIQRLEKGRAQLAQEDWQKIAEMTGQSAASAATTRRVAATLGVYLSARKLAQVAPIIGAAVGAGVNGAFQTDVSRAAQFAFRARWLEVNEGLIEGAVV
ncbi:EcsC family protein [Rhodobacteraceae bacterium]|nr:EcsC family protein [Paracoccaceae bacterium]